MRTLPRIECVFAKDSAKTPSQANKQTERGFMHAKGIRPVANTPTPAGADRAQRILGGALWLGLTALLVYLSY